MAVAIRSDPIFQAMLEAERAAEHQRRVDSFWALTDDAIAGARELVAEGDPNAIMDTLKLAAKGLTDVSHESVARAMTGEEPPPRALPEPGLVCLSCGLRARRAQGLKRHLVTRHPDQLDGDMPRGSKRGKKGPGKKRAKS